MPHIFVLCLFVLMGATTYAPPAAAQERRLAFVATNQDHVRELIPLQFSHADGDIVAAALRETGFDVQRVKDASRAAFRRAFAQYIERVKAAGPDAVALVYFSGHVWADVNVGMNYLILDENLPEARAAIQRQDDSGRTRALLSNLPKIGTPLREVTAAIRALPTKALFVVIDSHLDVAEPALVEAPREKSRDNGVMLVAQGRPGMPAADSNDFSKALAGALLTPGLDAAALFKQVQVKVIEVTNGKQAPWIEDKLNVDFTFTPKRVAPQQPIRIAATDPQYARVEEALWEAVREADNSKVLQTYLERFPLGRFTDEAKKKSISLVKDETEALSVLSLMDKAEHAKRRLRTVMEMADLAEQHVARDSGGSGSSRSNSPEPAAHLASLTRERQRLMDELRDIEAQLVAANSSKKNATAGETRIALVIGNATYKHSSTLTNPLNDAKAMAQALRDLRFTTVLEHYDLDRDGFVTALKAFSEAAKGADWAVVYYAGHGMELSGANFLLPVSAKLERIEDAEDEAVPVKRLFDRMADVKGIKIVILDACRDNPIAARALQRRGAMSYGLGQPTQVDSGTLIALAADPGKPAYDGKGPHSPYAEALLKHIMEPKLDVRLMFGRVNDSLMEAMPGKQESWIQVKLSGQRQYFFKPE